MQWLRDRFETTDGSRPEASAFSDDAARGLPLAAFSVVAGAGSAFEGTALPRDVRAAAAAIDRALVFAHPGTPEETRVRRDAVMMLRDNPQLAARVAVMKRVRIDVVAAGVPLSSAGFPRSVDERCAGVFWDHPGWAEARIGFRAEHLANDPVLVVHEVAHALHRLAFTRAEQKHIDDLLLPTVGSKTAVDEVFAIYSEAEQLRANASAFDASALRAPGVYGWARGQWNDGHLFTRFVRKLYTPGQPLAGEQAPRAASWARFAGGGGGRPRG